MPPIYSGLSEDDRFISKLLAAQNFMVNIQSDLTTLIRDYMNIRKKEKKRKEKHQVPNKRKKSSPMKPVHPPAAKKPKLDPVNKPQVAPVVQGMLKTRKNNLTLEDGNRLKTQIGSLTGEQQMTVLEILKENNEVLEQDDEGNVEMEFREFSQKSIDDLKDYVASVLAKPAGNNFSGTKKPDVTPGGVSAGKVMENMRDSGSDNSSDSSSSSDSDSDSDSD